MITMKGVTPALATIMLFGVSVAASSSAYYYITNMQNSADPSAPEFDTDKISLESCGIDNEKLVLSLRNGDSGKLNASDLALKIEGSERDIVNTTNETINPYNSFEIATPNNNFTETKKIELEYDSESFEYFCDNVQVNPFLPKFINDEYILERGDDNITKIRTNSSIAPTYNKLCIGNKCPAESGSATSYDTENGRIDTRGDEVDGSLEIGSAEADDNICIGNECKEVKGEELEPLTSSNNEMEGTLKLKSIIPDAFLCIGNFC